MRNTVAALLIGLLSLSSTLLSPTRLLAQTAAAPECIRDVSFGEAVLVVKGDGSVVTWGRSAEAVIKAPTVLAMPGKVLKVAVGGLALGWFTGYALLEDGTVVAWGSNQEGQLGNGINGADTPTRSSVTPVKVTGLTDIIAIGAGDKHAVALRKDGTVWAWGSRDDGATGDGEGAPPGGRRPIARAPVRVTGLEGITQIAVGRRHTLALTADGHVMSWGSNNAGELGVGSRATGWIPAMVTGLDHVVAIAAGGAENSNGVSGAIRDDGTVWMWGSNVSAMMGNGERPGAADDPGGRVLLPIQVKGVAGAKSLAIGGGNVAALLGDGTLRMWGFNGYGASGTGSANPYELRPAKTALTGVVAVYLGEMRSSAVRSDGTMWIWGYPFSQANPFLAKNYKVPTQVALP